MNVDIETETPDRKLRKNIDFRKELCVAINKHNRENGSNTPDHILADYLFACLCAYEEAVNRRTWWSDSDD